MRAARLLFAVVVSLALVPLGLLFRLPGMLGAPERSLLLSARLQSFWCRVQLFAVGVRVQFDGPAAPPSPCLIAANHVSYLDIFVLGALFPARFVAKREIAGWPLVGMLARVVGTLFIDREKRSDVVRAGSEIERTLAAGVSVVLFPEGGVTRGAGVDPLRSALFETPARARIPCAAVALSYDTPRDPWAPASTVCWWGGMTLGRHVWELLGLKEVRATASWSGELVVDDDRKRLAKKIHASLEQSFVPIRQEPVAPDSPWRALFE